MIQRKQTVYLALAALALVSSFIVPAGVSAASSWLPAVAPGLSALIALGGIYGIFQYADRARQRSIVLGLQYAALAVLLVALGLRYLSRDMTVALDTISWAMSAAPAAVAYVLFLLARKAIEKDIALVRSMDRLR